MKWSMCGSTNLDIGLNGMGLDWRLAEATPEAVLINMILRRTTARHCQISTWSNKEILLRIIMLLSI